MILKSRTGVAAAVLAAACALGGPAAAHPHAWIDLAIEVHFDASGRVTGLRETWLFDDYYTAFATEGFDQDGDGRPDQAKIDELMAENLRNLAEYDYFTRVESGGARLGLGAAADAVVRMQGARLELTFWLPLAVPAEAQAGVEYAIFDPTFYIEMLHVEQGEPVRLVGAPAGCRHRLTPPSPNLETVALAQALDQTQSAGDGLGIHFAERVSIRCGP